MLRNLLKRNHVQGEGKLEYVAMDENQLQQIQTIVDNTKRGLVTRVFTNLRSNERWKNYRVNMWLRKSH
jgi:hypothetical protein